MKIIGISFSSRSSGNCESIVDYCLNWLGNEGVCVEAFKYSDLNYITCGSCAYSCFASDTCLHSDDLTALYNACESSNLIYAVIPVYHGHLSAHYFSFIERTQGGFKGKDIVTVLHEKLKFILVGNAGHGIEMALQEVQYGMPPKDVLVLSSVEVGLSAIRHRLIENDSIKEKCLKFLNNNE